MAGSHAGSLAARTRSQQMQQRRVDADDAVEQLCQHGHAVVLLLWGRPWSVSAWEESPRGIAVTGHNPRQGWTGC
jgi:hypothetical protein